MAGLQIAFTEVLCFGLYHALLDMSAKMPPASHRAVPQAAGSCGGVLGTRVDTLEGLESMKKPALSMGRAVFI